MENTNKTLALLLVAAIVVSLGGTMISLEKLGQISITGKATTSGTATIEINSTYIVDLTDNTIDFGSGSLAEGVYDCRIYSENGTEVPADCWSGSVTDNKFEWENLGSDTMFVDLQSNASHSDYIGGDSAELAFKCYAETGSGTAGYTNIALADNPYDCASSVTTGNNGSTVMYVNVSTNAATGTRVATMTFAASDS